VAMVWNDAKAGDPSDFGAAFAFSFQALGQYWPVGKRVVLGAAGALGWHGVSTEEAVWERALLPLVSLRDSLAKRGVALWALVYPSVRRLDDPVLGRVYEIQEGFCREHGIAVVSALDALRKAGGRLYVHEVDNHPNARAHAVFARVVADAIEGRIAELVGE